MALDQKLLNAQAANAKVEAKQQAAMGKAKRSLARDLDIMNRRNTKERSKLATGNGRAIGGAAERESNRVKRLLVRVEDAYAKAVRERKTQYDTEVDKILGR